jgi:prevent-host-death family protein
MIMIQAGIKELKNNLSRFLAQVKAGEEIVITERGKPVARVIKEKSNQLYIRAALAQSIERGLVLMPNRTLKKYDLICHEVGGKPVSEMVVEDRR